MKIVICDVETTGLGDTDQVIELALVTIDPASRAIISYGTHLIKPTVPISPGARAVHHITDAELNAAPALTAFVFDRGLHELDAITHLGTDTGAVAVDKVYHGNVVAAHNAAFDLRMLAQSGLRLEGPVICTLCAARHVWPEMESHSNQALRYSLDLAPQPGGWPLTMLPPHRALPDALVTAALLIKMLETKTVDELIALTTAPVLQGKVRFGTHRGKPWADMDAGFLSWVLDPRRDFDADVKHTAAHWLGLRRNGGSALSP
jgi:exodeoxyribonuclease X